MLRALPEQLIPQIRHGTPRRWCNNRSERNLVKMQPQRPRPLAARSGTQTTSTRGRRSGTSADGR